MAFDTGVFESRLAYRGHRASQNGLPARVASLWISSGRC